MLRLLLTHLLQVDINLVILNLVAVIIKDCIFKTAHNQIIFKKSSRLVVYDQDILEANWLSIFLAIVSIKTRSPVAYLSGDLQVEPSFICHNHSHDGLNHQSNKGVHAKHQGITLYAQVNGNLKPAIKC